ncbi:hypothetical protein MSI_05990 [Treponema sp. JC4]|jgi:hypothetical protein|uniref:hypothetical protein n=1 Tax=Treponema sp. JC4 TaxID=1124982 RepID=UPI00025B0D91|nr:hypothetical protein [Treponema sp. JC4]EID85780.1 hypothetical protein MSI_05990 [Treponema sp. JC4]
MKPQKDYSDIINHEWNYASLSNRMPLAQRAKIFLPFAALTGYDEALQETLKAEIAEMEEKHGEDLSF